MICIKCKKEIPEDAVYCLYCGKKQTASPRRKRHAKRPSGTGSIVKLPGKRKRPYQAFLPAIYEEGRKIQKNLGCYATYDEADAALKNVISEGRESHIRTLEDIYQQFISGHYFSALSHSGQQSHIGAHRYLEKIMNTSVAEINTMTFQRVVNEMHEKGLSRETMAKVRNLSSLLCKECMRSKLMVVNFGALVQLPKEEVVSNRSFSTSELAKIWDKASSGNETAMAVILLCYTGMRPSEFLNIRIEQHIRKYQGWTYIQTGSKTKAGQNRIIPVPTSVIPFLFALSKGRDFGLLIPAIKGNVWNEANWRKRRFYPLMIDLGIDGAVPYTCRHTYSDLQKRRNVSPEIMMEVMGHADYSTTVEHYHSTTDEDICRICEAIDGLESPQKAV